jgi:hypothetical protein
VRSVVQIHLGPLFLATACWGCSSVGRAPALQAGCHRFDSDQLHMISAGPRVQHDSPKPATRSKHSDNRIRRVKETSHSEVFARFRTAAGSGSRPRLGVARAARLGRPEFRVTKLLRACGGCLGSRRRRRTWVAAISHGEPPTRL